MLDIIACFFRGLLIFSKITLKNLSMNATRVANSMDPDQVRRFVWPDLGPNNLRRLSADAKSGISV